MPQPWQHCRLVKGTHALARTHGERRGRERDRDRRRERGERERETEIGRERGKRERGREYERERERDTRIHTILRRYEACELQDFFL